jgi:hypothetical protein
LFHSVGSWELGDGRWEMGDGRRNVCIVLKI